MSKVPFLVGGVAFQSNLSLEEVGNILSKRIFGGLSFGGKEHAIHEEIPAIFINDLILGFQIILDGYPGYGEEEYYYLKIAPRVDLEYHSDKTNISGYLVELLKSQLREEKDIRVIDS